MSLNVFSLMFTLRSAFISAESVVNSAALHFVFLRHESSFVPNVVSVSVAQFIRFAPHLSVMHARKSISHVFLLFDMLSVFAAAFDAASSAARCARTISAKVVPATSVEDADAFPSVVSNKDDLF